MLWCIGLLLSREEAWTLYLARMEEEANYFSVGEQTEPEQEICTCPACIVRGSVQDYISFYSKLQASYESLYGCYFSEEAGGQAGEVATTQTMQVSENPSRAVVTTDNAGYPETGLREESLFHYVRTRGDNGFSAGENVIAASEDVGRI